jgi:hypothetical protein
VAAANAPTVGISGFPSEDPVWQLFSLGADRRLVEFDILRGHCEEASGGEINIERLMITVDYCFYEISEIMISNQMLYVRDIEKDYLQL